MRIRTIKPEFFKHDDLAELPPLTRLLFIGLWCMADAEGRLRDKPKRIKTEVLPYDDWDVERALQTLHDEGFIRRYGVDGQRLIVVCGFHDHQRLTSKEAATPSKYPAPPSGEECEDQGQRSDSIGRCIDSDDERDQPTADAPQAHQSGEGYIGVTPGLDPGHSGDTSGITGRETETETEGRRARRDPDAHPLDLETLPDRIHAASGGRPCPPAMRSGFQSAVRCAMRDMPGITVRGIEQAVVWLRTTCPNKKHRANALSWSHMADLTGRRLIGLLEAVEAERAVQGAG